MRVHLKANSFFLGAKPSLGSLSANWLVRAGEACLVHFDLLERRAMREIRFFLLLQLVVTGAGEVA